MPGVDTQFSHESGMATDPFLIAKFKRKHSPCFINKMRKCFTHFFFKIKCACHKCVNFSVTRHVPERFVFSSFLPKNDSFEGEKNPFAYKT